MLSRVQSRSAFTLIELMIAVIIMAIVSAALLLTMQRGILNAKNDDQVTQITALIEKARAYALSNYLVDSGEPAEYYRLSIEFSKMELIAVDEAGTNETMETLTFEDGFTMGTNTSIYYFPPDGDVCFNSACSGTTTQKTFTFRDTDRTYQTRFTITKYGGYPEVEEL